MSYPLIILNLCTSQVGCTGEMNQQCHELAMLVLSCDYFSWDDRSVRETCVAQPLMTEW